MLFLMLLVLGFLLNQLLLIHVMALRSLMYMQNLLMHIFHMHLGLIVIVLHLSHQTIYWHFLAIFLLYLHLILYLVCFFLFELCNNLLNILIYYYMNQIHCILNLPLFQFQQFQQHFLCQPFYFALDDRPFCIASNFIPFFTYNAPVPFGP